MTTKRKISVIYFDTNKILFYTKDLKNVLQINLSSDIISDLEIEDKEKFRQLIDNFFASNNLKDIEFDSILVFSSNTTFDKNLDEGDTKFKYEQTQKFLDIVPFEDMLSNSYKVGKKTKVVALNKSLYEAVKEAFEKNKAHIILVVPMSVIAENYPSLVANLDLSFIAAKIEAIKQFSLISFMESGLEGEVKTSIGIKKKDIRLYALLVVFGILLIVLLYMVYTTFLTAKPKPKINYNVNKTLITPTPSQEAASSSSQLNSSPSAENQ